MQMTVVLTILWKELREHLREPWLCVGVLVLLGWLAGRAGRRQG